MKSKATFRTACRDFEGFDCAKLHTAWRITDPSLPMNERGWFAYREVFKGGYQVWWLIEGRTGLAVQKANTLRTAVEAFLQHEVKLMTWRGLAANRPDVETLPLYQP